MEKQFENQFIGGEWKVGNDLEHVNEDKNPYTQETILSIQGANTVDVDEAYLSSRSKSTERMDAAIASRA